MKNKTIHLNNLNTTGIHLSGVPVLSSICISSNSYTLVNGIDYNIKDSVITFNDNIKTLQNVNISFDSFEPIEAKRVPDRNTYIQDSGTIPGGENIALYIRPPTQTNFETIKTLLQEGGITIGQEANLLISNFVLDKPLISMERPPPEPIRCEFRIDLLVNGPRDIEAGFIPPFFDSISDPEIPYIPYVPDDRGIPRDLPEFDGAIFYDASGGFPPITGTNIPEIPPPILVKTFSDPDVCIVENSENGIYIVPNDITYADCAIDEVITDFYNTSWSIIASTQPPRFSTLGSYCIQEEFWTFSSGERNLWISQGYEVVSKKKDHWTTWGENKWLVRGCRTPGTPNPVPGAGGAIGSVRPGGAAGGVAYLSGPCTITFSGGSESGTFAANAAVVNGYGGAWRFSKPGGSYGSNITVTHPRGTSTIPDGSKEYGRYGGVSGGYYIRWKPKGHNTGKLVILIK